MHGGVEMKRFLISLFAFVTFTAYAATFLDTENRLWFTDDIVKNAIVEFVPEEKQQSVADLYQDLMDQETGKISIDSLFKVCRKAGFNTYKYEGFTQCKDFIQKMLTDAQIAEEVNIDGFCPGLDENGNNPNKLRSITDKTKIGDFCSSTNIRMGQVIFKPGYNCSCMATVCNEGFEFKGGACVTRVADGNGNCLREAHKKTSENDNMEKCKDFCEKQYAGKACKYTSVVMSHSTGQCICNPNSVEINNAYESMQSAEERKINSLRYYEVCGNDRGKTGGAEVCEKSTFNWVNVGQLQAVGLAEEYARVRYNDDIACDNNYRTSGNDDYVRCSSKNSKRYYEFKFDDIKESIDADIQKGLVLGICGIHKIPSGLTKSSISYSGAPTCKSPCTSEMLKTAAHFGLTATTRGSVCWFSNRSISADEVESKLAKIDGIDNYIFYSGIQIQGSKGVITQLKDYIKSTGKTVRSFDCTRNVDEIKNSLFVGDDDILRCTLNGQPIDFVFDDFSESWLYVQEDGEAKIQCVVSGGKYADQECFGLTQQQCLEANAVFKKKFPSASGMRWNGKECVLLDSAEAQRYDIYVQAGIGVVAAADCLLLTHTGCLVLAAETAGLATELTTKEFIENRAGEFLAVSTRCNNRDCAIDTIRNAGKVLSVMGSLDAAAANSVDSELARLVDYLEPEDLPNVSDNDWDEIIVQLGGDPEDAGGTALVWLNRIGLGAQFASLATSGYRLVSKAITRLAGKAARTANAASDAARAAGRATDSASDAGMTAGATGGSAGRGAGTGGAANASGSASDASRVTATTTDTARTTDAASDASRATNNTTDVTRVTNTTSDVAQTTNATTDATRAANNASDASRVDEALTLTRSQAKRLDDLRSREQALLAQKAAGPMSASEAAKLDDELLTVQQEQRTLLNQLGNPSEEALTTAKASAYSNAELDAAQTELAKLEERRLYTTNRNGEQILAPGVTRQEANAVEAQKQALRQRIAVLGGDTPTSATSTAVETSARSGSQSVETAESATTTTRNTENVSSGSSTSVFDASRALDNSASLLSGAKQKLAWGGSSFDEIYEGVLRGGSYPASWSESLLTSDELAVLNAELAKTGKKLISDGNGYFRFADLADSASDAGRATNTASDAGKATGTASDAGRTAGTTGSVASTNISRVSLETIGYREAGWDHKVINGDSRFIVKRMSYPDEAEEVRRVLEANPSGSNLAYLGVDGDDIVLTYKSDVMETRPIFERYLSNELTPTVSVVSIGVDNNTQNLSQKQVLNRAVDINNRTYGASYYDDSWGDTLEMYKSSGLSRLAENHDVLSEPITTIRGYNVFLEDIPGANGKIGQISGRPIVVVNVNGKKIPFYISTGSAGNGVNKLTVPSGKWEAIFGIEKRTDGAGNFVGSGWFNKGSLSQIENHYGSRELKQIADALDDKIGDVRDTKLVNTSATRAANGGIGDTAISTLLPNIENSAALDLINESMTNGAQAYNGSTTNFLANVMDIQNFLSNL